MFEPISMHQQPTRVTMITHWSATSIASVWEMDRGAEPNRNVIIVIVVRHWI